MSQHIHSLKPLLAALAAGILFGLGLSIAQMIDPAKVVNFLNITGPWDPSLAFVMAGGLLVNAIATPLILKRGKPILAELFQLPKKATVDRRIILGGALFGAGWGIAGYCPGPLLTSLSFVSPDLLWVLAAYAIGTWGAKRYLV